MLSYKHTFVGLFIAIQLFVLSTTVHSQIVENKPDSVKGKTSSLANKPWPVSRFSVRLGGFWAINTTDIGAGLNGKKNASFDVENVFNMDRNTYSGMLNFNVRLGKHNRIDFSYYNIYRSSTATLKKDIQFGDHEYPVNSSIGAHLNTNVFRLSYGYSFYSNPKVEVGALIGFHMMAFNTGVKLNGNTIERSYKDDVNFMAPLPDVGVWGTYAFAKRWAVSMELSYFYLKYKSLSGRILNAQLQAQYKISEHWQIDLGYTNFDVWVGLDRKHLKADFDWNYNGPFLTGIYKFGR